MKTRKSGKCTLQIFRRCELDPFRGTCRATKQAGALTCQQPGVIVLNLSSLRLGQAEVFLGWHERPTRARQRSEGTQGRTWQVRKNSSYNDRRRRLRIGGGGSWEHGHHVWHNHVSVQTTNLFGGCGIAGQHAELPHVTTVERCHKKETGALRSGRSHTREVGHGANQQFEVVNFDTSGPITLWAGWVFAGACNTPVK